MSNWILQLADWWRRIASSPILKLHLMGLLIALLLLPSGLTRAAEYDANAPIEPELLEDAKSGDAYANYMLGFKLFRLRDAESMSKALDHLTVARDGYIEFGDGGLAGLAGILKLIGDVRLERAEYAQAIKDYEAAVNVGEKANQPLTKGLAQQALGIALQGLSRYEEAIGYFVDARQSISLDAQHAAEFLGDTYLNEGVSYEGMKDYGMALDAYTKAEALYVESHGEGSATVGYTQNNVAWVLRRLERFDESYDMFLKAGELIDRHEGAHSINAGKVRINLGIVEYLRGNPDEAIRWTVRAMPFIQENKDITLSDQRWSYDTLARAFRAKGEPDRAIAFAKLAVNAHQAIRLNNKELAAEDTRELNTEWQWLYQHLADLLIEQGRITEAQAALNMAKEQEVYEFLRRDGGATINDTRALLNDDELTEEQKVIAIARRPIGASLEFAALQKKLDSGEITEAEEDRLFILQDALQTAADAFEAELDLFLDSLPADGNDDLRDQVDAEGAYQSLLQSLPEKAAILQIAAIADATHLFLTLPDVSLHRRVEMSKSDLARQVFDALQAIETRAADTERKLKELHDILFAPVEDALRESGTEVVMLNLDGFLRYVPFSALFDGEHYAVEKFSFVLYSTAVPTQFGRAERAAKNTAGFGVTLAYPGFSALPGVDRELEAIFAGTDAVGVLHGQTELNESFTQRRLKRALLRRPEILHIASHFSLKPGRENDSFLLLGDGEHLPLSDIRRQKALSFRGVDLLTLSACQTALGSGDGSEIEGFAATAQLNGASAVLASLWPVSDAATPQLMHDFYHGMLVDGLSKARAMQRAQISMLSDGNIAQESTMRTAAALDADPNPSSTATHSHPYFWASFVLMGNWL